jgi:site-specific recombinase XerD
MEKIIPTQQTIIFLSKESYLELVLEAFLRDRTSSNLAAGTVNYYREKLTKFITFCQGQQIQYTTQITPDVIRSYMLYMTDVRHNGKGNVHSFYRSLRAMLYWYENEYEPDGWKNPIKKVKAPKQSNEVLEPVSGDDISKLLSTCETGTYFGDRDYAIILTLFDTGARAHEFLNINLSDMDLDGGIIIKHGKGDKPRTVYIGKTTRKAIRKYLKHRQDNLPYLWITEQNDDQLTYDGLRAIFSRRAKNANIKPPTIHSFRRAFALTMLRNGVDIFSLQKLQLKFVQHQRPCSVIGIDFLLHLCM